MQLIKTADRTVVTVHLIEQLLQCSRYNSCYNAAGSNRTFVTVQLEEEREVTAKLSKNLELERRKHESFEQRSKVHL